MQAFEYLAPLEAKLASKSGELTGYGSTFGNVDRGGDMVAPGAFAKSISEHKEAKSMPSMFWQHDAAQPIGVWLEAVEDQHGLLLKGRLTLETQRGAEARALAKDGALALSIGFQTRDTGYEKGRRVLKDLNLIEISLVSVPMNPAAKLLDVKSMPAEEVNSHASYKRFLKQHGFTDAMACRLAVAWHEAVRGDEVDAEEISKALKSSADKFTQVKADPYQDYWGGAVRRERDRNHGLLED